MASSSEYDRLLAEARAAFDADRTCDFQVNGKAARLAEKHGIPLERVRRMFLADALRQYIREMRSG